jgi:hypothetical protein
MINKYFIDSQWIVTYQRNEYSEIKTLYQGNSEAEAQKRYDDFIALWD